MLRAGRAPVACRAPLPVASYVKRRGVDAAAAPPLGAVPLPPLGLCRLPLRRSLAGAAPPLRAHREPRSGVMVCTRSSGELAAEVRRARCFFLPLACAEVALSRRRRRSLARGLQRPAAHFANPSQLCSRGAAARRWLPLLARRARTRLNARARSSTAKRSCRASARAWPVLQKPCSC